MNSILDIVEAWFLRHFGHITPGTPDYAVALAAKNDLIAALTESSTESSTESNP